MSLFKTIAQSLGLATTSVIAYNAQTYVRDVCEREKLSTATAIIARLATATVVYVVIGGSIDSVIGKVFGADSE